MPNWTKPNRNRSESIQSALCCTELNCPPTGDTRNHAKNWSVLGSKSFLIVFVSTSSSSVFFFENKTRKYKIGGFLRCDKQFQGDMCYGIWIYISYTICICGYNKYLLTLYEMEWRNERVICATLLSFNVPHTHTANKRERGKEREHNVSYICKYIYLCRYGTRQSVRHKLDKSICSYIVMQIQSRMRDLCVFYKGQLKVQSRPWLGKVAQWCFLPICYIDNNVRSIERCS